MKFSQKSIRIAALFAAILIGINFAASSELWLAYAGKVGENLLDSNAEATTLRLGEDRFPALRLTSIHDALLHSESIWIYQNGELMCVSDVLIEFVTGCTTETVTTPLYYAVHSDGMIPYALSIGSAGGLILLIILLLRRRKRKVHT